MHEYFRSHGEIPPNYSQKNTNWNRANIEVKRELAEDSIKSDKVLVEEEEEEQTEEEIICIKCEQNRL